MSRRAALFDMDRTLVRVNTGSLFMRWRFRRRQAGVGEMVRFAGWMAQYTFGVVDFQQVSTRALSTLAGESEATLRDECLQWYAEMVRPHVSDDARREVERCREQGMLVAILSASTPYATRPLAEELGIDHVLCTRLQVRDGVFTGDCEHLCYGDGKVAAAEAWAQGHEVHLDASRFYTDSVSDLPMLERVGEPRIINPDPRLRWLARRRGWPVERWR
ncbi:MAG: HAD family hydrolase [Myxococcota bacterium]